MSNTIVFCRLPDVPAADIIALMNNADVRRHLPLAGGVFDAQACEHFVATKEEHWRRCGYGLRAVYIDGRFAGWGGLQPEAGDADLALVLHPDYWGMGQALCRQILREGFTRLQLPSITALLPPTRTRTGGLARLGFVPDGKVTIGDQCFNRFRLLRSDFRD